MLSLQCPPQLLGRLVLDGCPFWLLVPAFAWLSARSGTPAPLLALVPVLDSRLIVPKWTRIGTRSPPNAPPRTPLRCFPVKVPRCQGLLKVLPTRPPQALVVFYSILRMIFSILDSLFSRQLPHAAIISFPVNSDSVSCIMFCCPLHSALCALHSALVLGNEVWAMRLFSLF